MLNADPGPQWRGENDAGTVYYQASPRRGGEPSRSRAGTSLPCLPIVSPALENRAGSARPARISFADRAGEPRVTARARRTGRWTPDFFPESRPAKPPVRGQAERRRTAGMLAIGRALWANRTPASEWMSRPRVSRRCWFSSSAPWLRHSRSRDNAVLLVEQQLRFAVRYADRVYIMSKGRYRSPMPIVRTARTICRFSPATSESKSKPRRAICYLLTAPPLQRPSAIC